MAIARTRVRRTATVGAKPREVTKAVDWPEGVKLSDVTAERICSEWGDALVYHRNALCLVRAGVTSLAGATRFVEFARLGRTWDNAEGFSIELGRVVFGSAAHPITTFADAVRPSERFPHIAAALQAVRGRLCLARGEPIVTSDLAMLASLDASRVRQLLRAGTFWAMKQHGTHIVEARDAKQWLADRGVAGFAPEAEDGV